MSELAFTKEELDTIQSFVSEKIVGSKSMTAVDMYKKLKSKLREDVTESRFKGWLSLAVKEGKIVGIKGKRRVGYVSATCPASSPPSSPAVDIPSTVKPASEPAPASEQPANEPDSYSFVNDRLISRRMRNRSPFAHHIWVDRKCYRVVGNWDPIEAIVFQVLNGKQDPEGRVVFNGKRYECDVDLFEKIIVNVLAVIYDGESDPVLDDGSEIPVELRIG